MSIEWFDRNVIFVQKLINMTLKKKLTWNYYYNDTFYFKDENFKFFHHEFCWLDSNSSFFTQINDTTIILAYEINENGKDGSISSMYRLLVGETGENGYIDEIKLDENHYPLLIELSYHIKGILGQMNPKAEKFIDMLIDKK